LSSLTPSRSTDQRRRDRVSYVSKEQREKHMSQSMAVFGDLSVMSREASRVAHDDFTVSLDSPEDSPTSVPCGITISITLNC
jgi:hypothetical protein